MRAPPHVRSPRGSLFSVLALLFTTSLWGQTPEPRPQTAPMLHIYRAVHPPDLADYVRGVFPEGQEPITKFTQRNPDDGKNASRETRAWLSYDNDNFYVVFLCKAEPKEIRARLSKRDDIFADDSVGIFIDTFRDQKHAYEFLVNPFGIQMDGINTEGQGDDWKFDTYWHSDGRLTPEGYAVRIAIPFKSLRFTAQDMQTWGVALWRSIPGQNETSFWPYITNHVSGFVQQFAEGDGVDGVKPGRNLRLIPYVAFGGSRSLVTPDDVPPSFQSDREKRVGLDAKLVIHDSLTLDATVNPDFSQIESDDPQVTVNQRFEVFFPEKRPFFLENGGYFQTPENLFFSRRISDPEAGARLTGRIGKWSLGILGAGDRGPGKALDPTDPIYGDQAAVGVVRIERDLYGQSTVGMFASSYDLGSAHNRVVAMDTRLKLNDNWVVTGQAMYSDTRYDDGTRSVGPGYLVGVNRNGYHFDYFANYEDLNPGFHTDLGFIPRVDVRKGFQHVDYNWRPKSGRLVSFGPFVNTLGNWNRAGRNADWMGEGGMQFEFRGATFFNVGVNRNYELFDNIGFHKHGTFMFAGTDHFKKVHVDAFFFVGTGVNYSPATGVNAFLTSNENGNMNIVLRPTRRLRLQETYFYTRLAHTFTNHIVRSQANYQFTPSLSMRTIIDYNAVLTNASVVDFDQSKAFTGDLLLAYIPHPGTAVYLGYTNRRENLALTGVGDAVTLARTIAPDLQTGSQVFLKVSYQFRF
jgi:Domain of unknown function (DUF5916)